MNKKVISLPLVSIITPVFNGARFIGQTLESIYSQNYPNIEHLVIDGGSNDGTQEIVESFHNPWTRLISEPDNGLYDAMNKGINLANGEYVGILNSDDWFINPRVVRNYVSAFETYNVDLVFAGINLVDRASPHNIYREIHSPSSIANMLKTGRLPPHPATFVRKSVYKRFGAFNPQYSINADADFLVRTILKEKIPFHLLNQCTVNMRWGGVSSNSIRNIWRSHVDREKIWRANQIPATTQYKIMRLGGLLMCSLEQVPILNSRIQNLRNFLVRTIHP